MATKLENPRPRRAKVADEPIEVKELEVSVGSIRETKADPSETDEFARPISDVRKLAGLTPAVKRQATRKVEKYYRGQNGASSKKVEQNFNVGTGYELFDVVLPPYNLEALAALYEKSSAHGAAVRAKVNNIVALGNDFVESDATKEALDKAGSDQKKLDRIRRKLARGKVELTKWLDNCNDEDTFVETLIKVWTDYETTGNGYLEVGRMTNGQVGYIGHIPATTMRIRKNRDGFVQIVSNKATFFRHFGDKTTANPIGNDDRPNEVIHIKKYSPTNGYYGVPDIIPALTAVAGNEFASKFNLDYFENKAVPRYVIIVKGSTLSSRSQENILEFFQSSVKGKNHRTLYVPLPPDEDNKKSSFEMKPVENGVQDASFTNYRKGNLSEILMAHGVPITKVAAADNIALAAARDLDKTFKEQVCRPQQSIFEKKLNKVIAEVTDVFVLKLNELSLTDEDTQSKIDERYARLGIDMPNEVRARRGMPGYKGGEKPAVISPQQKNEQATRASGNRLRDQQRTANSTDSASSTNSRNAQGAGRQQQ